MTDETFERIKDFVQRNAVPPSEYLPRGFPVQIVVDEALLDDEPDFQEDPCVFLRLSPNDFDDLQLRLKVEDREGETPPV